MAVEIVVTVIIAAAAVFILYKNFSKKSSGGCGCGKCSTKRK